MNKKNIPALCLLSSPFRFYIIMPVKHIAFLKFKKEISEAQIASIYVDLAGLKQQIQGLTEFTGGPYSSPEGLNKGFTHAFTMNFIDEAARDAYLPHPDHEVVKNKLVPLLEDVIVIDYLF